MPAAAMKVMTVDDQLSMRLLVQPSAGPSVSLIVSDYNVSNLDGLGLLRAVRVHPPTSKTAFIMLTGRGDKELVQKAVQFGVNNFLVKPFTIANLHDKVTAVFGALK